MNTRDMVLATVTRSAETRVPWTIYRGLLPRGQAERELREVGLGLQVQVPVYTIEYPHVEIERREVPYKGERMIRVTYHTPVGDAHLVQGRNLAAYGSFWTAEPLIKSVVDAKVMRYVIEDGEYEDNFEVIRRTQEQIGGDGIVLGSVGLSPFQQLVHPAWLGMDGVSYWLVDHRSEFDGLIEALTEKMDKIYDLATRAPVKLIHSDENVTALMEGPRIFNRYHLPFYERFVPRLHEADKLYATHFDGSIYPLRHLIAESPIDIVEAFTPPPMGDFSVGDAKKLWPEKVIWINFPGNIFLDDRTAVAEYTAGLLAEAAPGGRFVLGITENIPEHAWKSGLGGIADGFRKFYGANQSE